MKPIVSLLLLFGIFLGVLFLLRPGIRAGEAREESNSAHLSAVDPEKVDWTAKGDDEWKAILTPLQYRVCRKGGTERPWSGALLEEKGGGIYRCSCCGAPLFDARTKFDSQTGWPSFYDVIAKDAVELRTDRSFGMVRTEVVCSRCKAHLGHLFHDGPPPTGLRYCINSVCLLHDEKGGTKTKARSK
ncbi:MAG: peptide-methionine (R)-S-oxide reductase [Deltaproteobacteria bacterium]|nr:MAG: peptide-methionine (R)-S-oxide reductase [Deltaproteobacteria bacterium]